MSWIRKRRAIKSVLARVFSAKTSISAGDMTKRYFESAAPPPMSDFEKQYVPDEDTLDELLEDVSTEAGLESGEAARLYDRDETFPQFVERLLRAGAGGKAPAQSGKEKP